MNSVVAFRTPEAGQTTTVDAYVPVALITPGSPPGGTAEVFDLDTSGPASFDLANKGANDLRVQIRGSNASCNNGKATDPQFPLSSWPIIAAAVVVTGNGYNQIDIDLPKRVHWVMEVQPVSSGQHATLHVRGVHKRA